jgi:1,4-alpha-glucan branching enzyme
MWAHPGKKLLFMGGELAQWGEWDAESSLDWHLLDDRDHQGVRTLVRDLNRIYRATHALWEIDFEADGFRWLEPNDAANNVLAFARLGSDRKRQLVCVLNLSPLPRYGYRVGMPTGGRWHEVLNTDSDHYGGSGVGNLGSVEAEDIAWHDQPHSAELTLPPLGAVWLVPGRRGSRPKPG